MAPASKIIQSLCKIFSGGMDKSYQSDATKILRNIDAPVLLPSESQQAEIKKHYQIFTRTKNSKAI